MNVARKAARQKRYNDCFLVALDEPPRRKPDPFSASIISGANEIHFFQDLAFQIPIQTPRVLDAHLDPQHGAWLLMEEITRVRDDLQWTVEDYQQIVADMARFHAAYWAKTNRWLGCSWLRQPYTLGAEMEVRKLLRELSALRGSWLPKAMPSLFGSEQLEALESVLSQPRTMIETLAAPGFTLVHGDYWFHNLLLTAGGDRFLIDWQACHMRTNL